ncbi:hypothetical protein L218DRAFT_947751 [Marasmius fiardii PR-910]|nr:hypothetical protein L218DRAFT_947751 [Marasmius fiardii PR-910]
MVSEIKKTLVRLHTSGMAVNVPISHSIILRVFLNILHDEAPVQLHIYLTMLMRLVYAMMWEEIPPKLVINVDQMGIYVLPNSSLTWHTRGSKQVDIVAKEEKQAFSLLVFAFVTSKQNKRSHFSTLKTMKEWIEQIFLPYIQSVIEADPNLKDRIVSVDGRHNKQQIADGKSPEEIKMSTSLAVLHDASVALLVKAFEWMKGPTGRDLINKAWKNSQAKKWNLSAECLTSDGSRTALRDYLASDTTLFAEIQKRCGMVHGVSDTKEAESNETELLAEQIENDIDIPLEEVIKHLNHGRHQTEIDTG